MISMQNSQAFRSFLKYIVPRQQGQVIYSVEISSLLYAQPLKLERYDRCRSAPSLSGEMGMDYWLGKAQEVFAAL